MIRNLLIFTLIVLVYYALRAVFRSAVKAYHEDDHKRARLKGEEMVFDPQCRTYVPRGRAVARRVSGTLTWFCSESCAQKYGEQGRK